MSRMEIFGVKPDGEVEPKFQLKNSFLGAWLVWTELGNKYLGKFDYVAECKKREALRREGKDPDKELGEYDPRGVTRSWALQRSPKLTDAEWCVLMTTFDRCIVGKEHFDYVAECFETFAKEFPSHYDKCAEAIRMLKAEGYVGYCINATSVSQSPWWVVDASQNDEDGRPYNVNTDNTHWYFDPTARAAYLAKGEHSQGPTP